MSACCSASCGCMQVAELKAACACTQQQAQSAAQRAKREQQQLREQVTRLSAEVAALTEDRYELQVILASIGPMHSAASHSASEYRVRRSSEPCYAGVAGAKTDLCPSNGSDCEQVAINNVLNLAAHGFAYCCCVKIYMTAVMSSPDSQPMLWPTRQLVITFSV